MCWEYRIFAHVEAFCPSIGVDYYCRDGCFLMALQDIWGSVVDLFFCYVVFLSLDLLGPSSSIMTHLFVQRLESSFFSLDKSWFSAHKSKSKGSFSLGEVVA